MPSESTFLRLRPHIHLIRNGSMLYLAGDEVLEVGSPTAEIEEAMRRLSSCHGVAYSTLGGLLGEETAAQMHDCLARLRLLQSSPVPFPSPPVLRTEAYFESALSRPTMRRSLTECFVLLVGCGAIGGEVARHLAASGVNHLGLIDGDLVETSNLNRQYLLGEPDVGHPKVAAARTALLRLNPSLRVDCFHQFVTTRAQLHALPIPAPDAVVCCADTPPDEIASVVSEFARERVSIFAMATLGVSKAEWGPIVLPETTPSYKSYRAAHTIAGLSGQTGPPFASFGPTNSFAAAALARDLIHVLLGEDAPSLGSRILFDFDTLQIERFRMTSHLQSGAHDT